MTRLILTSLVVAATLAFTAWAAIHPPPRQDLSASTTPNPYVSEPSELQDVNLDL
ncbi:MAG: hypothetical protein AAF333_05180 [Planctomycetota bacterium]